MSKKYISENEILRTLKVPLCLIKTNGQLVDYNTEFAAMTGIIGSNTESAEFWSYIPENLQAESQRIFLDIFQNHVTESFTTEIISLAKEKISVEITPQFITKSEETLLLLSFKNNSETAYLQNSLKSSEEKYKELINNSPVGIVVFINGNIVQTNQRLVEILGFENESELVSKSIMSFFTPEFFNSARKGLSALSRTYGSKVDPIEARLVRKNGTYIDVLVAGHSIDYNGKLAVQGYIYDISPQKKIETALMESEDKFKKAFYTSPDSINISRLSDGVFVEINEGFSKLSGYSRNEIIGKSSLEVDLWVNEEDRNRLVQSLREHGNIKNLEAKFRLKDGSIKHGLMSASVIMFDNEPHIISVTRDIEDIKQTQIKLKESEERFRSMFRSANAIMLLIEPMTGKIVDANDAACKFYGYDHSTIVEKLFIADINKSFNEEKLIKLRKSVINGKKSFHFKHQLANGELRDVEVFSGKIVSGNRDLLYSIIYDITERRRAEESNIKLTEAVEQSPVSILITDVDGKIEFVNEKVLQVTGYEKEELIGQKPSIFKSGHTPQEEYDELWNIIRNGNTWRGEFHNKSKDGQLFWEYAAISPIKNAAGKLTHFLAVKEDITEDKEQEKSLIDAKEKAELSDKLKSEFLAQMSHEIRTPVSVILSFTNLLKNEFADTVDDEVRAIFESIEKSGQRIIRTIDLIINMSEIQTGSYAPEPRNFELISKIMEPLINEYNVLANKKNLELLFESDYSILEVNLDEYSTYQIFANLLDNAIKYTEKGFVGVKVYGDEIGRTTIEVRDTGIGISRKFLSDLFQPFSQEEQGYTRRYEGNGLGLAIVKKYCELNNAEIKVESTKGEGSKFTVKFSHNQNHFSRDELKSADGI